MPFNLLLLPLVGGYFLLQRLLFTASWFWRLSGNRLIIHSVLPGLFCGALAHSVVLFLTSQYPGVKLVWSAIMPPYPYLATSLLALAIGRFLPDFLNFLLIRKYGQDYFLDLAVRKGGTFLERFIHEALKQTKLVSLTLRSGKVYIGYVQTVAFGLRQNPETNPDPFLALLSVYSGYRHNETKRLLITTDYSGVFDEEDESGESKWDLDEFLLNIPFSEITLSSFFDLNAYLTFQETSEPDESEDE